MKMCQSWLLVAENTLRHGIFPYGPSGRNHSHGTNTRVQSPVSLRNFCLKINYSIRIVNFKITIRWFSRVKKNHGTLDKRAVSL